MEIYKGKLICNSLGNFAVATSSLAHYGMETGVVKCPVHEREFAGYSFLPAVINEARETVPARASTVIAEKLGQMSTDFGTTFTIGGDEIMIGGPKPGTPKPKRGVYALWDSTVHLPYKKGQSPAELLRALDPRFTL